jgi:hypothetical protein
MDAAPTTAAELLALPTYGHGVRRITCRCGHHIDIPYMAELRAGYIAENSILVAVDQDGVSWTPVNTEFGWKRRRIA